MEKGIKGFRLDAIDNIVKNEQGYHEAKSEKIHEFLHELNRHTFGTSSQMVTVGETGNAGIEEARLYSAPGRQSWTRSHGTACSGIIMTIPVLYPVLEMILRNIESYQRKCLQHYCMA